MSERKVLNVSRITRILADLSGHTNYREQPTIYRRLPINTIYRQQEGPYLGIVPGG